MKLNDLLKKKSDLKAAAEKLINNAMTLGKDLQGTELEQYNAHVEEIKGIESLIARHNELGNIKIEDKEASKIVTDGNESVAVDQRSTPEHARNFWAYMRRGQNNVSREIMAALSVGSDGVITPTEFDKVLVEKLINANVMRQVATVITTGNDRKIAIENALGAAGWAAEAAVSHNDDESDEPTFSQITLSAYKATRIEKISEELLQDAFFDLQSYLARKFGNAFGLLEEAAFVAGTGSGQPSGVKQAASAGPTTASGVAITSDELLATYHSLKRAYRSGASWMFSDSTALTVRKYKETTGQYIWQPGLQAGQPDTLLGKPVYISDFMPAIAVNARAVLFGDFSYYTIADRSPRTFIRLNELYAATGQVGFRATQRTDGKLTLAESVVALVQAAS